MPPYPSKEEIGAMFESMGPKGGAFSEHVDSNVRLEIMGHEHSTRNVHESREELMHDFFDQFEFLDWETAKFYPRHIIGGGESSWASVEILITAKSKKGKPFNHEFVAISNFNTSGKITEIRAYFDSAHLNDHLEHHNKA